MSKYYQEIQKWFYLKTYQRTRGMIRSTCGWLPFSGCVRRDKSNAMEKEANVISREIWKIFRPRCLARWSMNRRCTERDSLFLVSGVRTARTTRGQSRVKSMKPRGRALSEILFSFFSFFLFFFTAVYHAMTRKKHRIHLLLTAIDRPSSRSFLKSDDSAKPITIEIYLLSLRRGVSNRPGVRSKELSGTNRRSFD